jgi:hypothetical protein
MGVRAVTNEPFVPFWNGDMPGVWNGLEATFARVKLSKIEDYLADDASCSRLSWLGHAVNEKARVGSGSV